MRFAPPGARYASRYLLSSGSSLNPSHPTTGTMTDLSQKSLGVESRQRLLEAACHCFEEGGFRGATTRRIAEVAGVNEVTLFRLFGSKQQLIAESFRELNPIRELTLPTEPKDVERELIAWASAHLRAMREMRRLIRKTLAELDEHPEMIPFVCAVKTPHLEGLVTYAMNVRHPKTAGERDAVRTACTMLSSSMFADAIGRDVLPTGYPAPLEKAAEKYVRMFLQLLQPPTSQKSRRWTARARAVR